MGRRGRSASPPPAPRRAAARAPARPAPAPQQRAPVAAAPAPSAVAAAPAAAGGGPSMLQQMAVTAGGVAIGSAVGHTLGHAMTGMFSGGDKEQAAQQQDNAPAQQQQFAPMDTPQGTQGGACAWEVKQFIQCAQNQSDLTLCEGFNEAIRQCKAQNNML